jgi:OOP family OmpA-OmpF porin
MKKLLVAAAFFAVFSAGTASAQMYLGAGAGAAKTDTHETSWKLYGGYQFNPVWGLELGYTDLGRYRGSDIHSLSAAGTGTMPLADRWSLFGKLGASSNRPRFTGASDHTGLLAGVGVGYNMSKNIGLRLEYEDFGKLSDDSSGSNTRGTNLGLSAKYAF